VLGGEMLLNNGGAVLQMNPLSIRIGMVIEDYDEW
jgi:hypothetical protein